MLSKTCSLPPAVARRSLAQARDGLKAAGKLKFATVDGSEVEQPDVLIWVNYFLAQHYQHLGRFVEALAAIDAAISHTPSIPDMYLCKARIFRDAGDADSAWKLADEARQMDLADRYLNSECTQIMLQAGQVSVVPHCVCTSSRPARHGLNVALMGDFSVFRSVSSFLFDGGIP